MVSLKVFFSFKMEAFLSDRNWWSSCPATQNVDNFPIQHFVKLTSLENSFTVIFSLSEYPHSNWRCGRYEVLIVFKLTLSVTWPSLSQGKFERIPSWPVYRVQDLMLSYNFNVWYEWTNTAFFKMYPIYCLNTQHASLFWIVEITSVFCSTRRYLLMRVWYFKNRRE